MLPQPVYLKPTSSPAVVRGSVFQCAPTGQQQISSQAWVFIARKT